MSTITAPTSVVYRQAEGAGPLVYRQAKGAGRLAYQRLPPEPDEARRASLRRGGKQIRKKSARLATKKLDSLV